MLIKTKINTTARQFTKAPLTILFFGGSCYERCVKEKYFKNTH